MAGQQVRVVRQEQSLGTLVAKGTVGLIQRHYIISFLWMTGLVGLAFFKGFDVSEDKLTQYNTIMSNINHKKITSLAHDLWEADNAYRASRGWFSCDRYCKDLKAKRDAIQGALNQAEKEEEHEISRARHVIGITSTYGVSEAKDLFWGSFGRGKKFGQRQTMFDFFFLGFRAMNRDESLLSYVLELLMHFLINMTLGLIGALFGFTFSLWSFIRSYSPDFMTGLLFFGGAVVCAAAMVATYLTLLYGSAVGSVYVLTRAALTAQRLEDGQMGAGRRHHLHHQ